MLAEDGAQWSQYTMPRLSTFGKFSQKTEPLVDDIDDIVDEVDAFVDSAVSLIGFPLLLLGRTNGSIESFPGALVFADKRELALPPEDVEIFFETQGLNPFTGGDTMRLARLVRFQVFFEEAAGEDLELSFFRDFETSPYQVTSVPMIPESPTSTKGVATVDVGVSAFQHRVIGKSTSARQFALDALIPWFEEGGPVLER